MESVTVELSAIPVRVLADSLGVSVRTLTGWRSELRKVLSKSEFDWQRNDRAIPAQAVKALVTYQKLLKTMGKRLALHHLRIHGV